MQNVYEKESKDLFRGGDSRRSFLKKALGGAALATVMQGCADLFVGRDGGDDVTGEVVSLGTGDIGVLNYAYTLEQLEATFYREVVSRRPAWMSDGDMDLFADVRDHEVIHAAFYNAALGQNGIPDLAFDFSSVNFDDRQAVLKTARTFEDVGVWAYNGAGDLLENKQFLIAAGNIVSVEARHATAFRAVIANETASTFAIAANVVNDGGLDRAYEPAKVLGIVDTYIIPEIDASGLPTA